MNKNICVIIPIFNEAKTIRDVVRAVKTKALDVVVVNDGSMDDSGALATGAGAYVITTTARNGKGFALQQGFKYAKEKGYAGVIAMDGDGQHASEDLDKFILLAKQHPDSVIVGNRLHHAKDMPRVRFLTNWIMSCIISMACRQRIPDTQCGYRYIGMEVLSSLHIATKSYEIETEILMKSAKRGIRIYSVPVQTIYRAEESHIHPLSDIIKFIKYYVKELFTL